MLPRALSGLFNCEDFVRNSSDFLRRRNEIREILGSLVFHKKEESSVLRETNRFFSKNSGFHRKMHLLTICSQIEANFDANVNNCEMTFQ